MGIVSNELLLERGLRAEFLRSFGSMEDASVIQSLVMEVQSNNIDEKYGWLGQVPQLREWVDERQLSGLKDFNYTLANKDYESTLKVNKNVMDDDQLGAVMIRVRDLASRARQHKVKLFMDLLINGTTDLAYDGQPFFDTAHAESGTNQSNIVTGTGTTTAQFKADFISARARLRGFTDDQGEPFNDVDNLDLWVVAPVELEGVIDEVLTADQIGDTTNTLRGAAKKMVSQRLSNNDANDWYLVSGAGTVKPFIFQNRKAVEFVALEKGERAFMRKELLFGVDYRVGAGYGLWQRAAKVTNT